MKEITNTRLILLTIAIAVVTANAYYIHPIIGRVAESFSVSPAMIGLVPALNQIALAAGILLLLPLGDRMSNRKLVSIVVAGQSLSILLMVFSQNFILFTIGSTVLGFFTIAPYLLPAYVSKRVHAKNLGQATATLTMGVMAGIIAARAGGGIIAEHFGWQSVYFIAAALMILFSFLLPMTMEDREPQTKALLGQTRQNYFELLGSLVPLVKRYPNIVLSGIIQGLSFGVFLAVWLGIGLHLTSAEMGYGVDVVGYLAALSIVNLFTLPFLGRLADKMGAQNTRLLFACLQFVSMMLFGFCGGSPWLLIAPIVLMHIAGPTIDLTGRMMALSQPAEIRTRLMTIYIALMFIGGGLSSWAGTALYEYGGWLACVAMVAMLSLAVLALSFWSWRQDRLIH
ncbi:MAG: putative MFS family arabinose efflux permease [Parvicella sp.]|jgi:predicted MFS family arabinose efflux permease